MSKVLILLLLLMLPLSWTTSVAAAYCNHESAPAERNHLGHHVDGVGVPAADPERDTSDGTTTSHAHCSLTHSYCSVLPMEIINYLLPFAAQCGWSAVSASFDLRFADRPERPKWPVLA